MTDWQAERYELPPRDYWNSFSGLVDLRPTMVTRNLKKHGTPVQL